MPPIVLHLDDPIKAPAKEVSNDSGPTNVTKTITTTINQLVDSPGEQASAYPAARPGAAAFPAPTGAVTSPQPLPPPPTRTSQAANRVTDGPASPQPGAVPVAAAQIPFQAPMTSTQNNITPAPPQPGAVSSPYTPAGVYPSAPSTAANPGPPQIAPPPTSTQKNPYAPSPAIIPAPADNTGGATTMNLGPAGAHPANSQVADPNASLGGYQQNAYAQDLTAAQRISLQEHERREQQPFSSFGIGAGGGGVGGVGQGPGGGGVGGENLGATVGEAVGTAWTALKGWAGVAGEKLAEGEKKVWQTINKP